MARGHGRILTSIWEDPDFLALAEQQQRLYLFLISQPNLNHAGLLPLTLKRWARKAAGLTAADLEQHLAALDAARFIVLDDDTEELLIRSFVRNDGVWKQPKVMGAMVSGAMEISSRRLRRALLDEMDRIPLDDLSDEPTKLRNGSQGPSIRQQVADHIDALRAAFQEPTPDPAGRGSATPSETPSATPSDTPAEGGREASTRVGAGAHDARAPLPLPLSPAPSPAPTPTVVAVGAKGAGGNARTRDDDTHPIPPDFAPSDASLAWAAQHGHTQRLAADHDLTATTAEFVLWHTGKGTLGVDWQALWRKWVIDQRQPPASANLPAAVGGNVVPFTQPGPTSHNASVIAAFRARHQENPR